MTIDFDELVKRKYYNQSAAGAMVTISVPGEFFLTSYELQPGFVMNYPNDLFYMSADSHLYHFMPVHELWPVARQLLEFMQKDPNWVKKRMIKTQNAVKGLERLTLKTVLAAEKATSEKISKLVPIFKHFLDKTRSYWKESAFIDIFDPYQGEVLSFVFGDKKHSINPQDAQTLLLPRQSILTEENADFEKVKQLYQKKRQDIQNPKLITALNRHAHKYWWLQNDYQQATILKGQDFVHRLDEKTIKRTENLATEKKKLAEKYRLDQKTLQRIRQFEDLAYLRDIRKKFTQITNYGFLRFFHLTAEKMDIPISEVNFLVTFCEYEAFLRKDAVLLAELKQRTKTGCFGINDTANNRFVIESKRAKELFDQLENTKHVGDILYGNAASLGKAVGPAKIIKGQNDFHKFKTGDILITAMTRPEFVPVMKKAAAIVTDEGGITSHAAIVSRELGVPCVIGTKIATKVLKDGDLIEVNANHGFVRKLENENKPTEGKK